MKPTPEQRAIFESQAEVIKIKAGAGTGKTTTLQGLAAIRPRARMLYLAFNKAIKEEAQRKFPRNVRAVTAHGLAYGQVGKYYGNEPNKLAGDVKPFQVLPEIKASLSSIPAALHNLYGGRVIETLKAFLISPDEEMTGKHVCVGASPGEKKHFAADRILEDAWMVWEKMVDLRHPLPMIHDGYLKLFQLEMPSLNYDTILLDEAQDTNPVTQALVEAQWGRKIYVGDEHQAIYGFRGASNAMALIEADEDHLLTGSFRFGRAIAEVANAILSAKGEVDLKLRGLGNASVVGPVKPHTPHTFISRGNSALFARAVQALEKNESFSFVGPLYNYRLDLIEQTHAMSMGRGVSDPFLKAFDDFEALEEYAQAMEDREWMGRCKLVTKYGNRIPSLVARIQSRAGTYPGPGSAQVVLTSAHRAKGLEFNHVIMADDFMDFYDEENGEWKDLAQASEREKEEVNLQYVAATRAKLGLEVGEKLARFLDHQASEQRKDAQAQGAEDAPAQPKVVSHPKPPRPSFPRPSYGRPQVGQANGGRPARLDSSSYATLDNPSKPHAPQRPARLPSSRPIVPPKASSTPNELTDETQAARQPSATLGRPRRIRTGSQDNKA